MSRLTSLLRQMPDVVRPFMRYDHRPILTLACLDVSSWRLPEPEEPISVRYDDTIAYPQHIAVLHDEIIVSGLYGATRAHFDNAPSVFRDYPIPVTNQLYDLKVAHHQLMFLHSIHLYLDDKIVDLRQMGRGICVTPSGFVVLSSAPVECENDNIPGMLLFYEKSVYTHMVLTPHTWQSITWVGEGDVAFAATRLLKGVAEVSLLSINGMVIKTLSALVDKSESMGLSVLYDPIWEEYLISGTRRIMALSNRGASVLGRSVYEYGKSEHSYYIYALTWSIPKIDKHTEYHSEEHVTRALLFCIRNKNLLVQMKMK